MAAQKKDRGALGALVICLLLIGALIFDICFLFPSCEGWKSDPEPYPTEEEFDLVINDDNTCTYVANPGLDDVKIYVDPNDSVIVTYGPNAQYLVTTVGLGNGRALVPEEDFSGAVLACCWRFENLSDETLFLGNLVGETDFYTDDGTLFPGFKELKAEGCESIWNVTLAPHEVKYCLALLGTPGSFYFVDNFYIMLYLPSQYGVVRDCLWYDLSGSRFSELPVFGKKWPYWNGTAEEESTTESVPADPPSFERFRISEDEDGSVLYIPNPLMPYVPIELGVDEKVLIDFGQELSYKVTLRGLRDVSEEAGADGVLGCVWRFENLSEYPLDLGSLYDKSFFLKADGSPAGCLPVSFEGLPDITDVRLGPGETADFYLCVMPEEPLSSLAYYVNLPSAAGYVNVGGYFPIPEEGLPLYLPLT